MSYLGGHIRAWIAMAGFLIAAILCLPIQLLFWAVWKPGTKKLPMLFFRIHRFVSGMKVVRKGTPLAGNAENSGTLIIANHTSYLDATILGGEVPCCFIAKSEVANWPLFGWMARASGCVFVNRTRRIGTGRESRLISERLAGGDNVVLFPEGTSSDALRILPFKSALFGAVEALGTEGDFWVQPVSVVYRSVSGVPLGRSLRPYFGWYGDMPFLSHKYLGYTLGPLEVVLRFHAPVRRSEFESRKHLASWCEALISRSHEHDLLARKGEPEPLDKAAFARPAPEPALAAE